MIIELLYYSGYIFLGIFYIAYTHMKRGTDVPANFMEYMEEVVWWLPDLVTRR